MQRLAREMPYGPGLPVQKIECVNYLLRNYCHRLRDIAKKNKNRNGQVPIILRKKMGDSLMRLRTAVTSAIAFRSQSMDAIKDLEEDIRNGPYHVFGDHGRCASYFCKGPKQYEVNLVPDLISSGLWEDILYANSLLSRHSPSLIKNVTNNQAEAYNSYVAKYVGGKRVNLSLRGTYTTRCQIAAAAVNTGYKLHTVLHKGLTNVSPGVFTKKFAASFERQAASKRKRRLEFGLPDRRKQSRTEGPDIHYGFSTAPQEDDVGNIDQEAQNAFLSSLSLNNSARDKLEQDTRDQRLNSLWFTERWKRLTASSFGRVCKLRKTTSKEKVAESILFPSFRGSKATEYGNANEKLATSAYEKASGNRVLPAGLFVDEEFPFLAASPDGIISDQEGIIEIKCPYSCREMSPEEAVEKKLLKFLEKKENVYKLRRGNSFHYQIQGQMKISKKEFCDFVVWTPHGLIIDRVEKDTQFWENNMRELLKNFYLKFLLPRICRELPND